MRHEIVRVAQAIALDIRAIRILRIGPPVIALGKEVVNTAGAAWRTRGRDGHRLFREVPISRFEHTAALFRRQVEPIGGACRADPGNHRGRAQYFSAIQFHVRSIHL